MHIRISSIIALGCLAFLHSAKADTISLKSGETVEGKIIREDETHYVVEVVVSGTIKDEKKIARADVKNIDKKGADEKAFDELGIVVPTPDLLDKEAYDEWIAKLEGFVKAYPDSPRAKAAKGMLDTLGTERALVAEGGIKFGNEMVAAGEYDRNAYEFDVKIAEKKIRDAVARRDFIRALRLFSGYCEKFGDAEGCEAMNPLMLQVLGAYKATLEENLAALDMRMEKRKSGLASMAVEDRSKTERALKDQMEKIEMRYQKEKSSGQKWITSDAFHKASMDDAMRSVDAEVSRLRALQPSQPLEVPLADVYRIAWNVITELNEEEKLLSEVTQDEDKPADNTGESDNQAGATDEPDKQAGETVIGETQPPGTEDNNPDDLSVEAKAKELEEKKKHIADEKMKVIEEAKAKNLTEFYLQKLRIHAGFAEN